MTARFTSIIVVLEKDTREDDAEGLIEAIRHMRGVADAKGYSPGSPLDWEVAQMRIRREYRDKLMDVLWPELAPGKGGQ